MALPTSKFPTEMLVSPYPPASATVEATEAILVQKEIFAPLAPQTWGEHESKSPKLGRFRGHSRIYARLLM